MPKARHVPHAQPALCPTCHTNLTQVANTSPLVRPQFLPLPQGSGREGVISRLPQVQFGQGLFQLGEPKSSQPNCICNFDSIAVTFLVSRKLRWSRARFVWLADNATVICCHFQRYFYCETNRRHLAGLQWGLPNPQGERENAAENQTDSMNRR